MKLEIQLLLLIGVLLTPFVVADDEGKFILFIYLFAYLSVFDCFF